MKPLIFVIDDDETVRHSLAGVLGTHGFRTRCFASAAEALSGLANDVPACVVLDIRMPEIDGLTAQSLILERYPDLSIIMITGHGDIPMAVKAMKNGAADFIEKPVDDELLATAIRAAILARRQTSEQATVRSALRSRYQTLTERERSVALLVLEGYTSAAISKMLEISIRTVDHHRASILAKMEATSISQLIRMLLVAVQSDDGKKP